MSLCCRDQYYVHKYSKIRDTKGKTLVEEIINADKGRIVFKKSDIILRHNNSASIVNAYRKMLSTYLS